MESSDPTVSCDDVAMSAVPFALDVMMEFGANEVAPVPPEVTPNNPEILVRVVVATQLGTPLAKPKTKPFVDAESLDNTFVFDAYKISPVVYDVCPVPP